MGLLVYVQQGAGMIEKQKDRPVQPTISSFTENDPPGFVFGGSLELNRTILSYATV
jgi:hypothetical protein